MALAKQLTRSTDQTNEKRPVHTGRFYFIMLSEISFHLSALPFTL